MILQVSRNTRYFAIKDSIFGAIRYFMEKGSKSSIDVKASYSDEEFTTKIYRDIIISYLGYDFRQKKKRFEKEIKPGKKLYSKVDILRLYAKIIERQFEEVE